MADLVGPALLEPEGEEASQLVEQLQGGDGAADLLHTIATELFLHGCEADAAAAAALLERCVLLLAFFTAVALQQAKWPL